MEAVRAIAGDALRETPQAATSGQDAVFRQFEHSGDPQSERLFKLSAQQ